MTRSNFIKEHKDLIRILKKGDKKGLRKEYKEQSAELKRYLKRK